ncbi:CYTH domain-containing protein [Streptococcus acidominimus]|uniref:Adenylate cyclase n=1 Tax=Streptococcus acidominimus TaxID=1326 RepID=A0A1Q8EFZ6_STRAI|nr:CYTH domain-containing protein [Streptococcus acidominimus]MBF0849262.1 CYTH domain-containing protein [Streptococcus danieliae]MBF0818848.1 CYTH domain-containing protein [Streptococcus acidominimus]MBF0839598.1 CYTH domain-containing protein [Streptococcus acidominimus]OLF50737.1 adenylate cyclase [Streptococcus acidominimus]TFU30690.1 CYTH domain-containing protein [Streptococcus acidominimus]
MKKNHLEIEYKTLLTESEFDGLNREFDDVLPIYQTNYYIDTPDFDLRKHRCSLRIRTLKDRAELTLKIPQKVGNQEYNQELSLEEAQAMIQQVQLPEGDILRLIQEVEVQLELLKVWGHLATKRYEKKTSVGLMALDENSYAGQIDYELEVEVQDAKQGKLAFEEYLKQHHIDFKYASSKVARTAAALNTTS